MKKNLLLKSIFILLFAILLIGASCQQDNTIEQPAVEATEIEFETIDQGTLSTLEKAENFIIENNDEWQELWVKVTGNLLSAEDAPEINFDEYIIIAVAMGQKNTGGHSININKITADDENVNVYIEEIKPETGSVTTQALTYPYHMVKIEKTDKTINFIN